VQINNILIFILVSLFSITGIAQKMVVPGYQGKRMLVGLNFEGMTTLDGFNSKGVSIDDYSTKGLKSNIFAISGRLDAQGAYVLSRRMTATLSVGTGKAGVVDRQRFTKLSSGQSYDGLSLYNFQYTYATIGLQLQKKKRWGIAPIGPYWGMNYRIARSGQMELKKAELEGENEIVPVSECDCSLFEDTERYGANLNIEPQVAHSFQFIFGSRSIIKDHFYYDLSTTLDPIYFTSLGDSIYSAKDKMNQLFIWNIRIGVGMLF